MASGQSFVINTATSQVVRRPGWESYSSDTILVRNENFGDGKAEVLKFDPHDGVLSTLIDRLMKVLANDANGIKDNEDVLVVPWEWIDGRSDTMEGNPFEINSGHRCFSFVRASHLRSKVRVTVESDNDDEGFSEHVVNWLPDRVHATSLLWTFLPNLFPPMQDGVPAMYKNPLKWTPTNKDMQVYVSGGNSAPSQVFINKETGIVDLSGLPLTGGYVQITFSDNLTLDSLLE